MATPMSSFWALALFLFILSITQGSGLSYEAGKTYKYSYETAMAFNTLESPKQTPAQKDQGLQLSLEMEVTPVFHSAGSQLFRLKLSRAKATSFSRQDEEKELGSLLKYPLFFELEEDRVERVYMVEYDSIFSTNLKKGIAALFQVKQEPDQRSEIDVSGECMAEYSKTSQGVTKVKKDCKNLEIMGQYSNANRMMGVSVWGKTSLDYQLEVGVIKSVTGSQQVASFLPIQTALNAGAHVSQTLKLQEVVAGSGAVSASSVEEAVQVLEKDVGKSLIMTLLPSSPEQQQCTENCESPAKLTKTVRADLTNDKVATLASAKAVVKLLSSYRNAGKDTIAEVLTSPDSYHIVSQLIDVTTAAQTLAAQNALLELLDFEDENSAEHARRFLLGAAYATHPGEFLLKMLLGALGKKIATDGLRESLLLSTGAIVHTFCQVKGQCQKQVVTDFEALVEKRLAACEDDGCRLVHLQSFGNAGLPSSVATLLKTAQTSPNSMLASTALLALRRMPADVFTEPVKNVLFKIYAQLEKKHDTSVRSVALDLLLKNSPSAQVVQDILLSCLEQDQHEFATFVLAKLFDTAKTNVNLREVLQGLQADRRLTNYNTLAQRGKSSAFTSLLAQTKDTNCSYTLRFENSNSGVMKRSGMVVDLVGKLSSLPFVDFGIYADGLESLVGESGGAEEEEGKEEEEGAEPAAGMSLTLMDVILTQIEFFRGTGGLMSAVWNAPSELTSALQGNLLMQDHYQQVHLSNGLIADIKVTGVASIDLSGYVSISLWNRNCESLIKNSGAFYVQGSLSLASDILYGGVTFSGEAEAVIDFASDAEFYEMPLKLCLQMIRPEFKYVHRVEKFARLRGQKGKRTKQISATTIPGRSFFLNQANSLECKAMKK